MTPPNERSTTVLVVAPSSRGHDPAPELAEALDHLRDSLAPDAVGVAVLAGDTPSIVEALDHARTTHPAQLILVSAQTVPDRSFDAWCRRVVGHWIRTRHPPFPILIAPSIAVQPSYSSALREAVQAARGAGAQAQITDRTAPLLSPAWETVPGFTRHVLVCRGPRCSALGAGELAAALDTGLAERSLTEDDVLVTQTGCLFPCSQGPVLVVYPDNTWYAQLTPDAVPDLVREHLIEGRPLLDKLGSRRDTPTSQV